ncbi:unnamed protein product [Effrenium voratum]|nr:unnamed protein product [Effrenium voratum]
MAKTGLIHVKSGGFMERLPVASAHSVAPLFRALRALFRGLATAWKASLSASYSPLTLRVSILTSLLATAGCSLYRPAFFLPFLIAASGFDAVRMSLRVRDEKKVDEKTQMYDAILQKYDDGTPEVRLARQAESYALYFDIDMYGSQLDGEVPEPGLNSFDDADVDVLLGSMAGALQKIYPQFAGLEVVVFSSSGVCLATNRYKASFHVVFPQIIVERPVMCHEKKVQCAGTASHILVRDHVTHYLSMEEEQNERLKQLRKRVSSDLVQADDPDGPRLNDWCEILDEMPLWHDPRPGRCTGVRLPYTDKELADGIDPRTKLPLGRWWYQQGRLEKLPPFADRRHWVRLGDISCRETPTELDVSQMDPEVDRYPECPVCRGRR